MFDEHTVVMAALDGCATNPGSIHGVAHWGRVCDIAERLAVETGGDVEVCRAFAMLHDARRLNDWSDPGHGARGAALARELHADGRLPITSAQLDILVEACARHSDGLMSTDPTIAACWDADRMDLPRLGIITDPRKLHSDAARELTPWAANRARTSGSLPFVFSKARWGVPMSRVFPKRIADVIENGLSGFPLLNAITPVWGEAYRTNLGVTTESELCYLFGHADVGAFIRAFYWHGHPNPLLWCHGTTAEAAQAIKAGGFAAASSVGWRWGGGNPLGGVVYLAGPEQAAMYGPWMVITMLEKPPFLWNDPQVVAVRQHLGLPDTVPDAMKMPLHVRKSIAPAMRAAGIHAIRYDTPNTAEVVVYDPATALVFGVAPTRGAVAVALEMRDSLGGVERPPSRAEFTI